MYNVIPRNSLITIYKSFIRPHLDYGAIKNMSNKYGQKIIDTTKKSLTDAIKTASKRAIPKTAKASSDLVGNKIADKITSVSKKESNNKNNNDDDVELATHKKRYISLEERQQIINELRLVPNSNI